MGANHDERSAVDAVTAPSRLPSVIVRRLLDALLSPGGRFLLQDKRDRGCYAHEPGVDVIGSGTAT
jgi:hypothetical protein